jgi:8-oxo-dGTP pyrophosphatase MutT (NUDIX family)
MGERMSMMDVRSKLETLLEHYRPEDMHERADLQTMRTHLVSLENPMSRHQGTAHFTASALVVNADETAVCLIHHGKLRRWLQPGGHVEPEDMGDVERTALREVKEETGLEARFHPKAARPFDVDVHTIPARPDEAAHAHLDVRFLLVADAPERLAHDGQETLGARWMTWDEALATVDDASFRRLLGKARRLLAPMPSS